MNEKLQNTLVIIAIIALGLLAFNQFIEWKYNAQLLMQPCALCTSLNPSWQRCYENSLYEGATTNFTLKIP